MHDRVIALGQKVKKCAQFDGATLNIIEVIANIKVFIEFLSPKRGDNFVKMHDGVMAPSQHRALVIEHSCVKVEWSSLDFIEVLDNVNIYV